MLKLVTANTVIKKPTMLKFFSLFIICFVSLQFITTQKVQGQFRSLEPTQYSYTGSIVKEDTRISRIGNLADGFRFNMSHQYSMNFMSGFGGGMANVNAYTNLMNFGYGEKFSGQIALSFFHNPLGGLNNNGFGGMNSFNGVAISNAEFNYRFNENFSVQVGFSQVPNAFGSQNGFNQNPFYRSNRRYFD